MDIPVFIMMVGLVGSGKTVKAHELAEQYDATVFSSDSLREELFGDVNHQADNDVLFKELHKRIKDCLKNGKSAIMDATNINYKKRMAFLAELKNISCEKICVLMATPYEECLKRNAERDRKVPDYVIERMYHNFNVPFWYEGFDKIHIIYSQGAARSHGQICDWIMSVLNYNQNNKHHSLTLGDHCLATFRNITEGCLRYWELGSAALLHDCGKTKVATYVNAKGETTDECHYYQHQYCGAYDSLFFSDIDNHLYVAQLIQWHMHPYMSWKQSEKAKERDKKMLGEMLFNDIMTLHKADQDAH